MNALWWLLLLALMPVATLAHNGAVALAVPVEGIRVDGEFSDWPEGMKRYPIALWEFGDRLKDEQDFQGFFRVGYQAQEKALYIAVEIEDDSVIEDGETLGNTSDVCEINVELRHGEKGSTPIKYRISGHTRGVSGAGRVEDMGVEVQRGEKGRRYEWRLDLGRMSEGQVYRDPEMVLGFDVGLWDKDGDGSASSVSWGGGGIRGILGDLVLVGKGEKLGKIRGRMKWEGLEGGIAYGRVRIQSLESERLWMQVEADQEGGYGVEVPEGRYRVESTLGRGKQAPPVVEVRAGSEAQAELSIPVSKGEQVDFTWGKGQWHTYDATSGLVSGTVMALLQDRDGNMWFGTWGGGVSRYDGYQWKTFTTADGLANNCVFALFQDREGNIWSGNWEDQGVEANGVSRFDGQGWKTFTAEDGLADNYVWFIFQDRDGYLWFGTGGKGLSRFDGQGWKTFTTADGLASNWVGAIFQDRDGDLWFGTGKGLSRYDGQEWKNFTTADGVAGNVACILQGRDGQLWFGTYGGRVGRYDGQRFTTEFDTAQLGLGGLWINSGLQDREGALWFGVLGGGVLRYDGREWALLTKDEGLAHNRVRDLLEDREGNLWIATSGGVSRYDGETFRTFTAGEDSEGGLTFLLPDREGNLWFGRREKKGVSRYDGEKVTRFMPEDGLRGNINGIFQDREGKVWFCTDEGLCRYDGKTFTILTTKGLGTTATQDREGNLWFALGGAAFRYDGQHFETFTPEDGLAEGPIWTVYADQAGKVWVATVGGGVSRFDGKEWTTFTTADGLANNSVWSIFQDREGRMWFGTDGGGVSCYDGQHFRTYDTRDGLVGTWVTAISQDRKGVMWFGTGGGGVSRFDGQVFQSLAQQDGLADNSVDAIAEDQEGNIWLGTGKGLTRFRPPLPSPPPVFVDAVVADQRYEQVTEVSTPSTVKLLAFEFHGISFKTRPEAMVYRYRLSGYDPDWRTTHARRVEYEELPAGEYTFEVQAVDRDLSYSEQPAQVRVSVHRPYERIAWISVTVVGLLLFLWQTVRIVRRDHKLQVANRDLGQANHTLRETQAQLVQAEKLATVGLLAGGVAHEINNPLQALLQGAQRILKYPEDIQRHQQSASLMEQAALRCSAIVQNLLNYTRRSGGEFASVDLNAVVDSTLALLQSHLGQAGIAVRVEKGVLPAIEGNFNELCTVLTNLLMNARDALATEGNQGIIGITTAKVGGEVMLRVRDNGPGIPAELKERIFDPFYTTKPVGSGTGLGLSIVQGIVQRHQGRIEVESEEGGGVTFAVYLPTLEKRSQTEGGT